MARYVEVSVLLKVRLAEGDELSADEVTKRIVDKVSEGLRGESDRIDLADRLTVEQSDWEVEALAATTFKHE